MFSKRIALIVFLSSTIQSCTMVNDCDRPFEYPIVRVGAEGSMDVALSGIKESIGRLGYSLDNKNYVPLNGVCYYKVELAEPGLIKVVPYVQDRVPRYLWKINNEVSDAIKKKLGVNSKQYEVATEIILQD